MDGWIHSTSAVAGVESQSSLALRLLGPQSIVQVRSGRVQALSLDALVNRKMLPCGVLPARATRAYSFVQKGLHSFCEWGGEGEGKSCVYFRSLVCEDPAGGNFMMIKNELHCFFCWSCVS